jgi:hypothetical protein
MKRFFNIIKIFLFATSFFFPLTKAHPSILSAHEVKALFSGQRVQGYHETKKFSFVRYYLPTGVFIEDSGRGRVEGHWYVNDAGRLCEGFGGGEVKCRNILKQGGKYSKVKTSRKGKQRLVITYRSFNPHVEQSAGKLSTTLTVGEFSRHQPTNTNSIVLSLPPKITFETVDTAAPLPGEAFQAAAIADWVQGIANKAIEAKGFNRVSAGKRGGGGELTDTLTQNANIYVRKTATIQNEDLNLLRKACIDNQPLAVLSQYMRVKVGQEKSWKIEGVPPLQFSLSPTAGTHSTYFRAVLRQCDTGKVIWRDSFFLRELPKTDSASLNESLQLLYRSLPEKAH